MNEKALREEFKLHIVHEEETFYRTFKISQKDLLDKLRASSEKEREEIILELYSADSISGRRGVTSLNQANAIMKDKIKNKERLQKFATKFTDEGMSSRQIRESGLFRSDMLY